MQGQIEGVLYLVALVMVKSQPPLPPLSGLLLQLCSGHWNVVRSSLLVVEMVVVVSQLKPPPAHTERLSFPFKDID